MRQRRPEVHHDTENAVKVECSSTYCLSKQKQRLYDVFFKNTGYSGELEEFDCFISLPSDNSNHPLMSPNMNIMDVPRYKHFDNHEFPEHSSYFMYGDKENVFLFHIPTKSLDFFQVITLCQAIVLLSTCT